MKVKREMTHISKLHVASVFFFEKVKDYTILWLYIYIKAILNINYANMHFRKFYDLGDIQDFGYWSHHGFHWPNYFIFRQHV